MNTMHFYTSGNVPLEIWGKENICLCTIWNTPPNAPTTIWGVPQDVWDLLSDKGVEITPSMLAGEGAKFTLSRIEPSDWDVN